MSIAYFRSAELLAMAAEHACTIRLPGCKGGPCVSCHSNQAKHGKGKSVKAHDCFIAFGCSHCHYEIDQGKNLSAAERTAAWERGHIATMLIIFAALLAAAPSRKPRALPSKPTSTTPRQRDGDLLPKIVPRRVA